jgi:gas vesicle protein
MVGIVFAIHITQSFFHRSINFNIMATNNKLLVGVLIGAAAGAAIGYLLTTDKGKELLSNLQDAAGTAGDKVRGAYDTAKSKVSESFGRSKQYAEDVKNNV